VGKKETIHFFELKLGVYPWPYLENLDEKSQLSKTLSSSGKFLAVYVGSQL